MRRCYSSRSYNTRLFCCNGGEEGIIGRRGMTEQAEKSPTWASRGGEGGRYNGSGKFKKNMLEDRVSRQKEVQWRDK